MGNFVGGWESLDDKENLELPGRAGAGELGVRLSEQKWRSNVKRVSSAETTRLPVAERSKEELPPGICPGQSNRTTKDGLFSHHC